MDNEHRSDSPSHGAAEGGAFVFLDACGKRWPRLRLFMAAAGLVLFAAMILFARTLLLPSILTLPPAVQQLKGQLKGVQAGENQPRYLAARPLWLNFVKSRDQVATFPHRPLQPEVISPLQKQQVAKFAAVREIRLGFYEGWDPASLDSLKANAASLTHLSPDWLTMEDGRGAIKAAPEPEVLELARERGLALLPLLRNIDGEGMRLPEAVEGVVNGPVFRQDQFIAALMESLQDMDAGGVVIDWQDVDPAYREAMTALLARMAAELHADSMELWLSVPMGRGLYAFDLDGLAPHVDRFVAMLHDENAELDPPGPIASREWFNGWLTTVIAYGQPEQWVLALGSYGYDWAHGEPEAEMVRFQDAMSRAGRSALAACDSDAPAYNPHFVYEDSGVAHTLWFLDAVTFAGQLKAGRQYQVGGVAISRLGTEDPGIWDVLRLDPALPLTAQNLAVLETIRPGAAIAGIGRGNIISIEDGRADGRRRIVTQTANDPDGLVTASYEAFPAYLTIIHQGRGPREAAVITFDDGPDPRWTPRILDILKAKGVSATFFMVGANMEQYPDLVRRIVAEGHTAGVHTYTHPNIALVSEERAYLEFNATQRLFEAITGRSTILFRPPYNADTNPHTPEELIPVQLAQKLGYVTVTEDIDPEDWARPGVVAMVADIGAGRRLGGSVILLHDAGGDRRQTVEALPAIIDYLRARGDRILSLPALAGISPEQVMPPLSSDQRAMTRMVSKGGFTALHAAAQFFWAFMIAATALVVARTLIIAWLAIRSRRSGSSGVAGPASGAADAGFCPPVSVLIAAYNEEKVIGQTLQSVLRSSYPGEIEVVVVDDGSRDGTAQIVSAMAADDPRIRLLRQVNKGKATALQAGLAAARHEIIVSLDADTQFVPETIGELVRPFADPAVGAVSGRARVGNPKTLVARFQSLEYICGFNLDRRAYHRLNCITVVPGAVSALRKSAVLAAGGISTETLAEDTDLTLALHRCGYRVCYAPRAEAWTEAPETIRSFAKQRFRWAFGTLQCLWKHRDMLFNGKYRALGWFSLPSAWFFNILLVALGPVIDGLLLVSLILSPAGTILYWYFFVFLCADLLLAAVACLIEREPLAQIWLVLPMRFIYRPVLSYAVIKAIVKAGKGALVGWGKLERTASVPYHV